MNIVCPSVVITAVSEFKITKPVMQSTEQQGSRCICSRICNSRICDQNLILCFID